MKFVGIPVAEQDRALAFYTEKLGFQILSDQAFSPKRRWNELTIPGAATGIALFTPDGHEDRIGTFVNSCWEMDDLDRTSGELSAQGVQFSGPPDRQPCGSFFADD